MNIVLVCNEYPPLPHGGIGTFVETYAHGLHLKGHKVTVVEMGKTSQQRLANGIEIVTLRRSNLQFIGNLITRVQLHRWLRARVKANTVDVVEVPDYHGYLPLGLKGCVVTVRLHLTTTSIWRQAGKKPPKGISFYERSTLMANRNWIAVSRHVLDLTQATFRLSPERCSVIYNPVPLIPADQPQDPGESGDYVLYAGQLSERKGALVLAQAALRFLPHRPDLRIVYIGGAVSTEGQEPLPERIRKIVGPKLAERVHFHGHLDRNRVLACMRTARVFVFPSRLEACPMVLLEAMSCGVPVICTREQPGPEVVEDEVTGLLIDPTSPKELSDKIERLLDDPAEAMRLVRNARKVIDERFSIEQCVQSSERFYKECMGA